MFPRIAHLLPLGFMLAVTSMTSAQSPSSPVECPAIDVEVPSHELAPGEEARFTLRITPKNPEWKFRYKWTLSEGQPLTGQDTDEITVKRGNAPFIDATVHISGGPDDSMCPVVSTDRAVWSFAGDSVATESCPILTVNGPAGIVAAGDLATYTANIDLKGFPGTPTFRWTTSVDEIVSGQGTNSVKVRQPGRCITATVEVGGFPDSCPLVASEMGCDEPPPEAVKIGEMSSVSVPNLELVRRFRDELRANPNNQGFIFIAYPPNLPKARFAARENALRDLLTTERAMTHHDRFRITLVQAPSKHDITEFWRVPPGASNPKCESCDYVRDCSSIGIERKGGIVKAGDQIVFSVRDRAAVEGLSFHWIVRNGTIEGGQGTSSIRVLPTTYVTRPVEATLKVRGLTEGCADTFEESYAVPCHPYLATSIDVSFWSEYNAVPWTSERKQLEGVFARGLRWQPEKIVYIEKGFPLNSTVPTRNVAINRIRNYLLATLKIPRNKLYIRSRIGRSATRLYLVPNDSPIHDPNWKESCVLE